MARVLSEAPAEESAPSSFRTQWESWLSRAPCSPLELPVSTGCRILPLLSVSGFFLLISLFFEAQVITWGLCG